MRHAAATGEERVDRLLAAVRRRLLDERDPRGHWVGELSTSALATATASAALAEIDPRRHADLVRGGLDWLAAHANADGGYGDTVDSRSNVNTTTLVWAALNLADRIGAGSDRYATAAAGAARWIAAYLGRPGRIAPRELVRAILAFYGSDRTFSTPICSLVILCGRLGDRRRAFALVPALPFELAALPRWLFRWLRLPVVSYAIPALVAIGQSRAWHRPSRFAPLRQLRRLARRPTLELVRCMQPSGGGFLEAPPLPSFVALNLAAIGLRRHPIVRDVVSFLRAVRRPDGSWPICTDLATWTTTLGLQALAVGGPLEERFDDDERDGLRDWLLAQQHRRRHPFTDAAPGGWGWSDRSGAIADADDTPGALLALDRLCPGDPAAAAAAARGARWLLDLQNRDGGIPTFCRGWNRLPFDRSAADISAHVLRALLTWRDRLPRDLATRTDRAVPRLLAYLRDSQRSDGSWLPLWFGNQWAPDDENPVYGTARVLLALCLVPARVGPAIRGGTGFLLDGQEDDGAWAGAPGRPPSIEETALAVDALAAVRAAGAAPGVGDRIDAALERGVAWLDRATDGGTGFPPAPIGFYFAKLWYHERLYPVVFTCQALERVAALRRAASRPGPP